MKLFNKMMALLMTVAMISTITMTSAFAAGEPTLTAKASADTIKVGDTVDVTISLSNNPNLCAMYFYVEYDEGLTLTKRDHSINEVTGFDTYTYSKNLTDKPYAVCWETSDTLNTSGDGNLLKLTFTATAAGTYNVGFKAYTNGVYNDEFTYYDLTFVPTTITVESDSPVTKTEYFGANVNTAEKPSLAQILVYTFTTNDEGAKRNTATKEIDLGSANFETPTTINTAARVSGIPDGVIVGCSVAWK